MESTFWAGREQEEDEMRPSLPSRVLTPWHLCDLRLANMRRGAIGIAHQGLNRFFFQCQVLEVGHGTHPGRPSFLLALSSSPGVAVDLQHKVLSSPQVLSFGPRPHDALGLDEDFVRLGYGVQVLSLGTRRHDALGLIPHQLKYRKRLETCTRGAGGRGEGPALARLASPSRLFRRALDSALRRVRDTERPTRHHAAELRLQCVPFDWSARHQIRGKDGKVHQKRGKDGKVATGNGAVLLTGVDPLWIDRCIKHIK